jgi:NACalpha-BTF3-like transcription factor
MVGITLAQAKKLAKEMGMTISNKNVYGEYKVNFKNGSERAAVYEVSVYKAIMTAISMANMRNEMNARSFAACRELSPRGRGKYGL